MSEWKLEISSRAEKELLGHATLSMAMKYAHLSQDHKSAALEKLGELFSG